MSTSGASVLSCLHCRNAVPDYLGGSFCCAGCELVYQLLQDHDLGQFYDLSAAETPAPSVEPSYCQFDDWNSLDSNEASFYLENTHCTACVWLIQHMDRLNANIVKADLNLNHSLARIQKKPTATWSDVAKTLDRLGYTPHLVDPMAYNNFYLIERHKRLREMGVAAFAAGNIMLLAISIYAGAAGTIETLFNKISFFLFLPALLYSARSYYRNAWVSLRARTVSIDFPIAFGITVGFVTSVVHTFLWPGGVYYDSLASLIFLLQCSRYLLFYAQTTAQEKTRFLYYLAPSEASRWNGVSHNWERVPSTSLQSGDEILVAVGERIPCDGEVVEGHSTLDVSVMTGEEAPIATGIHQSVLAGSINLTTPIRIRVAKNVQESRLGRILQEIDAGLLRTSSWIGFTDRVGKVFVIATFMLAALTFCWWLPVSIDEALNRFLAVVLVACPCIFALGTPLVVALAMGKAAEAGILVKNPEVFEKLREVEQVAFDKTGTLTSPESRVVSWKVLGGTDEAKALESILAHETCSAHPIARRLVQDLKPRWNSLSQQKILPRVECFEEVVGRGVRGKIAEETVEVAALEATAVAVDDAGPAITRLGFWRNDQLVAEIELGHQIYDDASRAVRDLQQDGFRLAILSGDQPSAVSPIAAQLNIPQWQASMMPEEKTAWIQSHPRSLMIGDGANDAAALQKAWIGVAMAGSLPISLKAADVSLIRRGLTPVVQLVRVARKMRAILRRNLVYSFAYNSGACALAMSGSISPLGAAVLMPLSAILVLGSSISWGHAWRS